MICWNIDLFFDGFGWNFHQAELLTQFFEFWGLLTWIQVFRGGNPWGSRGAQGPKLKLAFLDDIRHVGAQFGAACFTEEYFEDIFEFWAHPGPQDHPRGLPRGGFGHDFFKVSNPYMWVLYLGVLASLMNILKIFLSLSLSHTKGSPKGVTPGSHPNSSSGCGCTYIWLEGSKSFPRV